MSRAGALLVAVLAGALVLAASVAAATPRQIVARLNAERVANGIPGGIVLDPAWTLGCRHHVRYEELNGIGWTHVESSGRPGFTKDGQLAGLLGDQADTGSWDEGDPYEHLPLHLANLLQPRLQRIGAWDDGRRTCVEVSGGNTRAIAADAVYAAPGPGRTGVPASELVHDEEPADPGDVVGLPQGTRTGPTIFLFAAGPWTASRLRVRSVRLAGAGGAVPVRLVDPRVHPRIAPYVAAGVFFVIPVHPLAPATTYRVAATISGGGDTLTKRWSFRTA